MMSPALDAHQRPPDPIRNAYKKYQKLRPPALDDDPGLLDLSRPASVSQLRVVRSIAPAAAGSAFQAFVAETNGAAPELAPAEPVPVYEHPHMPVQSLLLSRLVHQDLSNEAHKTNIHMHYHVPYPPESASFFQTAPSSEPLFIPKDPNVHKPLSINQFLDRKLRWVTLGGQYDWTRKVYPSSSPPPFPSDVDALLQGLFPEMTPQAAIVNFYTPGDTLSMHRDVSEECDRGLVSLSIGCDGIFVIGPSEEPPGSTEEELEGSLRSLVIRLRSGDAVYMSGPSRFAWHGVPQIIPDTCPDWLQDWPASSDDGDGSNDHLYEQWRGWMRRKRVNVNVRQMWE